MSTASRPLQALRSQATTIAVAGFCLVALVVLGLLSTPSVTDTSSRGNGRLGTAALYDWFGSLGYDTHRMESAFGTDGVATIIIDNPTADITDEQATLLDQFARHGGRLIVASAGLQARSVLEDAGVSVFGVSDATSAAVSNGSGTLALSGAALVLQLPSEGRPLATTPDGDVVAAEIVTGDGVVDIIGDGFPLDNDGLRQGGNAPFVLGLAGAPGNGPIAFDDVHHQAVTQDGQTVIFRSPLGLGLLLAVVVIVVALATTGRHLGRPLPAADPGRVPSAADYIEAMAQLFERSSDARTVAGRYAESLKATVGRAYGVDPHLDDTAFLSGAALYVPELAGDLTALLAEARRLSTAPPHPADLVALARRIDAFEELLMPIRTPAAAGTMTPRHDDTNR